MSVTLPAEQDWVARLAGEVIAESERRAPGAPVVCASGLSPSGPIHLGNLREVMVPHLVADEIRRQGRACVHLLSWDDYDRFRKVPAAIEGIEAWDAHIGKPLSSVPAPPGSPHPHWAAHFRADMEAALAQLGVEVRGISQTAQYTSGAYRDQVLLAMRERATIDQVLGRHRTKVEGEQPGEQEGRPDEQGSGAAEEDDGSGAWGEYYPFKPYCHVCERDTTQVTAYDDDTTELTYRCACGHAGRQRLDRDFRGKLVWKVDWPMRWAYERVVFEPSGVDHHSPGSSWVVGGQLVARVFGGERPIGPMYAFVGISGMSKMSSSRGGVPTPLDALAIMEPALVRWLYARRRPNQAFTVAFDADVHRLYDEWDALERKVADGAAQPGDRAVHARAAGTAQAALPRTPRPLPYRALASVVDITGGHEEQMLRILRGMDDGLTSLDDARPRLDRASAWVRTQLPAQERTQVRREPDHALLATLSDDQRASLAVLAARLGDHWSLEGLTALVYGVPKLRAGLDLHAKRLPPEVKAAQRDFFRLVYRLLISQETGPRLPTLLLCLEPAQIRRLIGQA